MPVFELTEGIYVKKSRSKLGAGVTARECETETFWLPYGAEDGHVEIFPVTGDFQSVLGLKETVPVELFIKEYTLKDNSREIYLELRKMLP